MQCKKQLFSSRDEAKRWHKKSPFKKRRVGYYYCPRCAAWHITTKTAQAPEPVLALIRDGNVIGPSRRIAVPLRRLSRAKAEWLVLWEDGVILVIYDKERKYATVVRQVTEGDVFWNKAAGLLEKEAK